MLKHKVEKAKAFALTFDDGPGTRLTMDILKILRQHGLKATFFLLGRNIKGREQIVRQIAEEGHDICSHGYRHIHHWKVSPISAIRDIKEGWHAISAALGARNGRYVYRPPHGKLNLVSLLYLLFLRVPVLYWTFDSADTKFKNRPEMEKVASLLKRTNSEVILAHDFDRPDNSMDAVILESLRIALMTAKKNGINVVTVSHFLSGCKQEK